MTAIFVTGRLYSPVAVFTVTFRPRPSAPGYTLVTLQPKAHLPLTAFISATTTMSSTATLRFSTCHFFLGTDKTCTCLRIRDIRTENWPIRVAKLHKLVSIKFNQEIKLIIHCIDETKGDVNILRPLHLLPAIKRQKHQSKVCTNARNYNFECDWLI